MKDVLNPSIDLCQSIAVLVLLIEPLAIAEFDNRGPLAHMLGKKIQNIFITGNILISVKDLTREQVDLFSEAAIRVNLNHKSVE